MVGLLKTGQWYQIQYRDTGARQSEIDWLRQLY